MWHQMHSINLIAVDRTPHLHIFQSHLLAILTLHLIMYQVYTGVREREQISKFVVEFGFFFGFFKYNLHTFLWPASIFSADLCGTDRRAEVSLVFHLHFTLFSARRNALGHFSWPRPLPMPFIFLFSRHTHTHTHCRQVDTEMYKSRTVSVRVTLNICTQ